MDCCKASEQILREVLHKKKKLQDFQLGHTKVFLKDEQELFLEQERDRVLAKKIIVLQVSPGRRLHLLAGRHPRVVLQEQVPQKEGGRCHHPELLEELQGSQGVCCAQEGHPADAGHGQVAPADRQVPSAEDQHGEAPGQVQGPARQVSTCVLEGGLHTCVAQELPGESQEDFREG